MDFKIAGILIENLPKTIISGILKASLINNRGEIVILIYNHNHILTFA